MKQEIVTYHLDDEDIWLAGYDPELLSEQEFKHIIKYLEKHLDNCVSNVFGGALTEALISYAGHAKLEE